MPPPPFKSACRSPTLCCCRTLGCSAEAAACWCVCKMQVRQLHEPATAQQCLQISHLVLLQHSHILSFPCTGLSFLTCRWVSSVSMQIRQLHAPAATQECLQVSHLVLLQHTWKLSRGFAACRCVCKMQVRQLHEPATAQQCLRVSHFVVLQHKRMLST